MDQIRRDFRQIYAEGWDVLGGGGGMKFQSLPLSPRMVRGWERSSKISFFQLNVRRPCQIRCSTLKQMEEKRSKAVN